MREAVRQGHEPEEAGRSAATGLPRLSLSPATFDIRHTTSQTTTDNPTVEKSHVVAVVGRRPSNVPALQQDAELRYNGFSSKIGKTKARTGKHESSDSPARLEYLEQ